MLYHVTILSFGICITQKCTGLLRLFYKIKSTQTRHLDVPIIVSNIKILILLLFMFSKSGHKMFSTFPKCDTPSNIRERFARVA